MSVIQFLATALFICIVMYNVCLDVLHSVCLDLSKNLMQWMFAKYRGNIYPHTLYCGNPEPIRSLIFGGLLLIGRGSRLCKSFLYSQPFCFHLFFFSFFFCWSPWYSAWVHQSFLILIESPKNLISLLNFVYLACPHLKR